MNKIKIFLELIKQTFLEWNNDDAPMLAAALAYYTALSIAPLIIVIVAIVGFIVGQSSVQSQITEQLQVTVGTGAAQIVTNLIDNMSQPNQGVIASIIGIIILLYGALGLFNHLQTALDMIWDVDMSDDINIIEGFVKDKLLSFGMILIIGFLLLVSLIISTLLSILDSYLLTMLPGTDIILRILNALLAFSITTVLFGFIFKFLPHADIAWNDVWIGSIVTSLLFTLGQTILGLYLGNSAIHSTYGAAGAFVVLLVWVYYSAQIVLFGAEFTHLFSKNYGTLARSLDQIDA